MSETRVNPETGIEEEFSCGMWVPVDIMALPAAPGQVQASEDPITETERYYGFRYKDEPGVFVHSDGTIPATQKEFIDRKYMPAYEFHRKYLPSQVSKPIDLEDAIASLRRDADRLTEHEMDTLLKDLRLRCLKTRRPTVTELKRLLTQPAGSPPPEIFKGVRAKTSVNIDRGVADWLAQYGAGNRSAGVERAVAELAQVSHGSETTAALSPDSGIDETERRQQYMVSLPPSVAEWFTAYGRGNRSRGIVEAARQLASAAPPPPDTDLSFLD